MDRNCVNIVVPAAAVFADNGAEMSLIDDCPPPRCEEDWGIASSDARSDLDVLQRFNDANVAAPSGCGPPRIPSITA